MEIVDAQVRRDIINFDGSIVVSASAGSGKTTIMVDKIIKKLSEITNHQIVAALTFTVKATEEIKKKATIKANDISFVVMTNDSFVEYEIIRPFLKDAFGREYSDKFVVCYDFSAKVNSFVNGMDILKRHNKLGTYKNIKRNFKFELAKEVLVRSPAAREYFKAKYDMLFLDEYQDSDIDMHNFFMYLMKELNIDLFIVGDAKQAIYLWRGAQKNIFNLLEAEGMHIFELVTNFRSHPEILNYANLIHNESQFNVSYYETVERVIHCKTHDFAEAFKFLCETGELDETKSITIIANINEHAKKVADALNELGFKFVFIPKTPLDSGSENSHILKAIACYILDINYSIYDLSEVLRIDQRRTVLNSIEKLLSPINELVPLQDESTKEDIKSKFFKVLSQFNSYLGSSISETEKQLLLDTVVNGYYHPAFIQSNDLYKVMTVFSAKGLEFKQVISFSNYYDFQKEDSKNNHYVCVTRAEDKFIMIEGDYGNYSEQIANIGHNHEVGDMSGLYKVIDYT